MTQTVQSRSWAFLNNAGKDLSINKLQTEDNMDLLLSVFDSLNNLCEKLSRLNYVIQRRKMEQIMYRKCKAQIGPALRSGETALSFHL